MKCFGAKDVSPDDPNLLKTLLGVMGKSGTRFCERCKSYQPTYGTRAVKPWHCTTCKPRLVNK